MIDFNSQAIDTQTDIFRLNKWNELGTHKYPDIWIFIASFGHLIKRISKILKNYTPISTTLLPYKFPTQFHRMKNNLRISVVMMGNAKLIIQAKI